MRPEKEHKNTPDYKHIFLYKIRQICRRYTITNQFDWYSRRSHTSIFILNDISFAFITVLFIILKIFVANDYHILLNSCDLFTMVPIFSFNHSVLKGYCIRCETGYAVISLLYRIKTISCLKVTTYPNYSLLNQMITRYLELNSGLSGYKCILVPVQTFIAMFLTCERNKICIFTALRLQVIAMWNCYTAISVAC